MTEVAGISFPSINITGLFSSTWVYVLIVGIIGIILITITSIVIYYRTFNKTIVFFDNVAGLGYQPVVKRRARTLRVSNAGEELLAMVGGETITAYGRKMGLNTYWFFKGQDGYYYNCLLGDLDAKMAMMDINPVDKDVRMFHVAKDRMNRDNYLKRSFLEKHGITILMFILVMAFMIGLWILIGKMADATEVLSATSTSNAEVSKSIAEQIRALANLKGNDGSGIIPVG